MTSLLLLLLGFQENMPLSEPLFWLESHQFLLKSFELSCYTERDIEGMETTISHSMAVMYMQDSSSSTNNGLGSSSSHSGAHEDVFSATVGITTPWSFYPNSGQSTLSRSNIISTPQMPQQFPSSHSMAPYMPQQFSSSQYMSSSQPMPYGYGFNFTGTTPSNFNTNGLRSSTYKNSYGGSQRGSFKQFYNRGRGSNSN